MQKLMLVMCLLLLFTVSGYPVNADPPIGPRIVGGNVVAPNSLPYQVLLGTNAGLLCGGSLISPQWVLTAAHCVDGSSITAVLGLHDANNLTLAANPFMQTISVQTSIKHPLYTSNDVLHDIALLKLSSPATLTAGVQVIALANSNLPALYTVGSPVFTSGWGITSNGNRSQFLQSVNLSVISCAVPSTIICTGGSEQLGKGPCSGDSGGALVGQVSGGFVQAGIVSFGENANCNTSMASGYTKVSAYYSWIEQMGAFAPSSTATPTGATPTEEIQVTPSLTPTATYIPSNTNVGSFNALALTSNGIPVIAYFSNTHTDLMLAVCNDANCTAPAISVLDQAFVQGTSPSIALTSTNKPIIAYYDDINGNLKVIVCNNATCTNRVHHIVDVVGDVGVYPTIQMTSADLPVISYFDITNSRIKIAYCADVACPEFNKVTVDAAGNAFEFGLSMALNSADTPVISYIDQNDGGLKVGICNDVSCATPTMRTIATSSDLGMLLPAAIQVSSDNKPSFPYFDFNTSTLQLVRCSDSTCSARTQTALTGDQGYIFDMRLTTANLPVIAFYHLTSQTEGNLKVSICSNAMCTTKSVVTIDATGADENVFETSLELTSDNRPVMSYRDNVNGDLKLAICQNTSCTSVVKKVIDGQAVGGATASPTTSATRTHTRTSTRTATRTHTRTSTRTATRTHTRTSTRTATRIFVIPPSPTSFKIPSMFLKSFPANGATNVGTTVTMSWQESKNAARYEYCIASSAISCTNWRNVGSTRSVVVSGLSKSRTYYWHVRAINPFGTTPASGVIWNFTTAR